MFREQPKTLKRLSLSLKWCRAMLAGILGSVTYKHKQYTDNFY